MHGFNHGCHDAQQMDEGTIYRNSYLLVGARKTQTNPVDLPIFPLTRPLNDVILRILLPSKVDGLEPWTRWTPWTPGMLQGQQLFL